MSQDWQESGLDALLKEVRENVTYDPSTGLFTWLKSGRGRFKRKGCCAGSIDKDGYIRVKIDGSDHRAHRLAWLMMTGADSAVQIDHINGIRTDNRWSNLREATSSQNHCNSNGHPGRRVSRFKGVSPTRNRERWRASICIRGNHKLLGHFATELEASDAYQDAARRLHGEFARW